MKKILIIIVAVLMTTRMMAIEYAVIDRIVYSLDLKTLTATVLNFQTSKSEPCDVTIPPTVEFKNDTYTVVALDFSNFGYDSDLYYQYDKVRINIEHVYLPNTIETIWAKAFSGMIRLKEITLPFSVKNLVAIEKTSGLFAYYHSQYLLGDGDEVFPRLEKITILGTPECATYENSQPYNYSVNTCVVYKDGGKSVVPIALKSKSGNSTYISKVALSFAGISSLQTLSSKMCPNLKSFSMPAAEKIVANIEKYDAQLRTLHEQYSAQLKEHPYYDGSVLTCPTPKIEPPFDEKEIAKKYAAATQSLTDQHNILTQGQMEENLRTTNFDKFIEIYQNLHPDTKYIVLKTKKDFRCESKETLNQIIWDVVNNIDTLKSCRDRQYSEYGYLFKNREEFDESYDRVVYNDVFLSELKQRTKQYERLQFFIRLMQDNPKVKLQGMDVAKAATLPYQADTYIRALGNPDYYFDDAIDAIFQYNELIQKEYAKNGYLFPSRKSFFYYYISQVYQSTVRDRKKKQ